MSTIPTLHLPETITLEPVGHDCALLTGHAAEPLTEGSWSTVAIPEMKRYMALALHCYFVSSPRFGSDWASLPAQAQFILWEEQDGGVGVMIPLLHEDFRAEAEGVSGGIKLVVSAGPKGRARTSVALALVCRRSDPWQAVADGMQAAIKWMGRGCARAHKPTPSWINYLGWCTWDAFYEKVDEARVMEGLEHFHRGGIVPGQIIVDEGWQDYDDKHFLQSYGTKRGAFTGDRLSTLVETAKSRFGVKMVGCWRTLFGELRGVDVDSPNLEPLKRRRTIETNTEADIFGVVEPEDVARFHHDYAARLASDGVDFVKVDFQSGLRLMTHEQVGRAEGARIWQHALQDSVTQFFNGEILNCMAMGSDEVYHTRSSNVCRASDDYFPTKEDSHPRHLWTNMYNAVWLGQCQWPDWDMFQSGHPWGRYHAIARALSGGPVYVSDKPGTSDYSLLKRLVAADGKVLRCDQPARVTRDLLFVNPLEAARLLKVQNLWQQTGLLGVFHPGTEAEAPAVEETVTAADVDGLGQGPYAAFSLNDGFIGVVESSDAIPVKLNRQMADLLLFVPCNQGFAGFGLVDKFNPAPAILEQTSDTSTRSIKVRGGGRFGFYSQKTPQAVSLDGKTLAIDHHGEGYYTCDTAEVEEGLLVVCF